MGRARGYILFETIVALGLLSVSMVGIHNAVAQSLELRARAQDLTVARFLLEDVVAEREFEVEMRESSGTGSFEGEYSRFSYAWTITKIEVPVPPLPAGLPEEEYERLKKMFKKYMGKIHATISWERRGQHYEIAGETLTSPETLWVPESEREQ